MGHGTSLKRHTHFLSVVICVVFAAISGTNAARYEWKTGLWMECQHHICGEGGTQYRSVYCAQAGQKNYNKVDKSLCSNLRKPTNMQGCFKVCKEHQNELHWAHTVWSDCQLKPGFKQCSIKNGVRYRNVTCMFRSNGRVESDDTCWEFEAKPDSEESCDLKCPQDCIVTEFSSWAVSNCDTCLIVNKTRTRQLVVPPDTGTRGKPCPPFTEMIPCDNCTDVFTYRIGQWDTCIPFDQPQDSQGHIVESQGHNITESQGHIRPLLGQQNREIYCINSVGVTVSSYYCVDHIRSSLQGDLMDTQTCIIPQDCEVSKWSQWSPYNSSCIQRDGHRQQGYIVHTRSIIKIPLGTGKSCPNLIHYFELAPDEDRPCVRTKWKMTSWSKCEVPHGSFSCTTGLQTRKAICVQEYDAGLMKPVDIKLCLERQPITAQTCVAECDINCSLSQWTSWTECKVNDCELYVRQRRNNEGTGQRYRTRGVLTAQQGNGAVCPHLSETQTCDPQPCYRWNFTVGQCHLLNPATSPTCGLGVTYRTMACVNKLGHRVDDVNCAELEDMPEVKEDCDIPCPRDCILSPWGPWSSCPTLCQEGRTRAAIQTRERTVLAQAGVGGAQCPPQRQLKEVRTCPTTIECAIYVWQSDPWGPCKVNKVDKECGSGIQNREVNCYNIQGQLVSDKRCTLKERPRMQKSCRVPCPVDCEVTEFSDWSICSATCWKVEQNVPLQTHKRYIIKEAQYGGKPCPDKLMEVKHCNNFTVCEKFEWKLGPWSLCVLPPDRVPQCGEGLQVRDISCERDNGTIVEVDVCVRQVGPTPDLSKRCYKSCDMTCTFTDWSEWSMCVSACTGKRWKTRKLIESDTSPVNPKCRDTRFYPRDSYEDCICATFKPVPIGNWSACILEPDVTYQSSSRMSQGYSISEAEKRGTVAPRQASSYGIQAICGSGTRYQVLACQNDQGEVEAASICSLKSYKEERCMLPCPVDCVMSDWSLWADCSTSCGTGIQLRYRHIRQVPSDSGRRCPQLDDDGKETQSRVCHIDCEKYKWREYSWQLCMPTRLRAVCGNGTQSRSVRCEVYTKDGFVGEPLDERLCYDHYKPMTRRACYSPCVGECVVSEWTHWTMCKPPCADPNQVQTRTRTVLRQPSDDPVHVCPALLEERFCIRGDNCQLYTWTVAQWTTCLINNGTDGCGVGHQERYAACTNEQGKVVDNNKCVTSIGAWLEVSVESCEIPCDTDCLMTEWTDWSHCSESCDLGVQKRVRDIVQEASGNGRKCRGNLEEGKPCFLEGCYTWIISNWSTCISERGLCGDGVQRRNVTCMANGGLSVNTSNCKPDLDVSILTKEQHCIVPCPGECVISDWTPWTKCYIHCKDYDKTRYTRGIQSRSRAVLAYAQINYDPCPQQLWASRSCDADSCFTFIWQTSSWTVDKTRHVWCERSDGLRVTGGCSEDTRPSTELSCSPECSIPGSFCNNTNICVCMHWYASVYNRLNVLIECVKMDNYTDGTPTPSSVTLPTDGPTNIWMYAVIGVATVFIICLAVACYTMSEFFNKGPRPRRKEEEQNNTAAGLDSVDTMVNHVPSRVPVMASPMPYSEPHLARRGEGVDSSSMASIDRTPPNTVGAPARPRNVRTPCVSRTFCECLPFFHRKNSFNDDSPEFLGHSSVMHDMARNISTVPPNGSTHVSYCDTDLDSACFNDDTDRKRLWPRVGTDKSMVWSSEDEDADELDGVKTANTEYSTVNPIRKPNRAEKALPTHVEEKHEVPNEIGIVGENVQGTAPTVEHSSAESRSNTDSYCENRPNIVYLNREASTPDISNEAGAMRKSSFEDMLGSILDKKLTVTGIDINNDEFDDFEASEDSKLIAENGNVRTTKPNDSRLRKVELELVNEDDEKWSGDKVNEPLLGKQVRSRKPKQSPLICMKSYSLEQAEHKGDRSYDSDDSIGNAGSLMSHTSTMSRMSKLSMTHGPSIKIDPEEARSVGSREDRGSQSPYRLRGTASLPSRKMNIGYITFSSIDTDNSEAPASSGSCDSLSPRSLPSEPSSYKTHSLQYRKNYDTYSDKSVRNVAIGSLKHKEYNNKHLVKSDDDSGRDSLPKDMNGSPRPLEQPLQQPVSQLALQHIPPINIPEKMSHRHKGRPLNGAKLNGDNKTVSPVSINGNGTDLKSPYYYQDARTRRASLKKQNRSEIEPDEE